jgi:hypothetical protein
MFVLVLSAGVASATDIYTDEASFLAAVGSAPYYLEEFDGYTYGSYVQPSLDLGPVEGFSYTLSAPPGGLWSGDGNMSTSNAADPILADYTGGDVYFTGGWFFCGEINGAYIPGDVLLELSDGTSELYAAASDTDFRGFVTDVPLTGMSIDCPNDDDTPRWATMDHYYVGGEPQGDDGGDGGAVPATTTIGLVLMVLALGGGSAYFLRRK